jgi:cell division protein FtsB
MILKKISNSKNTFKTSLSKMKSKRLNLKFFLLDLSLVIVIVALTFNIFIAYKEGVDNLTQLRQEEDKLIKLQEENARLNEEENYYRSIEFRKAYAKESLNMSGQGETLYYVMREEDTFTTDISPNLYNFTTMENIEAWKLLIFGD